MSAHIHDQIEIDTDSMVIHGDTWCQKQYYCGGENAIQQLHNNHLWFAIQ